MTFLCIPDRMTQNSWKKEVLMENCCDDSVQRMIFLWLHTGMSYHWIRYLISATLWLWMILQVLVLQRIQCWGRLLVFSGVNISTRLVLLHAYTFLSVLLLAARRAIFIIFFTSLGLLVIFLRVSFGYVEENILYGKYTRWAANLTIDFFLIYILMFQDS